MPMAVRHLACVSAISRGLRHLFRANPRRIHRAIAAYVSVCLVGLLGLCGCGHAVAPGNNREELPQAPMVHWANPIGGVIVASIRKAQRQVPFKISTIPGIPKPYRILLTPGRPANARVVVLQYKTSHGLVEEYEELPQVSMRQFRTVTKYWVGLNGKKGTTGTVTAIQLAGGYPAALSTAANKRLSSIRWIEPGVEYMIMGPRLTKRDCITLANLQA